MEEFALAALGLLFGIVLCLLSFAAYLLYRQAVRAQEEASAAIRLVKTSFVENQQAISALKLEVTSALTRLDASAMHEASLLIQRTQRQFARSVDQFMKLLHSQEGASQI